MNYFARKIDADRAPSDTAVAPELSLTEMYYRWFEVVRCDTPERIAEAHRLRYQVYCLETGFEDPADNPGGLETDAADSHALHSLLVHKPTGLVAGTVRLVLPTAMPETRGLPSLAVSPRLRSADPACLPPAGTAEISRFSISRTFRQRAGDGLYPALMTEGEMQSFGRRALPSITLGLMRAIVAMSREAGMSHLVAVIEPALERLLARLGIHFQRTGERVDFHGARLPVYRDLTELLADIHDERYEVWEAITDCGQLWPLEGFRRELNVA